MSDESAAAIRATRKDWTAEHRESYLNSGGREGHIVDVVAVGGLPFTTTLLLRYTGRKSGRTIITPLIYGDTGGEVVVVASKGGADSHPAWYLNVREAPTIDFQIATQAFRATWREPMAQERDRVWAFMADLFPPYHGYQASTERQIPLVMMKAVESIPVFEPVPEQERI